MFLERIVARGCSIVESLGNLVELFCCVRKAWHGNFRRDTSRDHDHQFAEYLINIGLESCALDFSEMENLRLCEAVRHLLVEVRSFRNPWLRKRRGEGRVRRSSSRAFDIGQTCSVFNVFRKFTEFFRVAPSLCFLWQCKIARTIGKKTLPRSGAPWYSDDPGAAPLTAHVLDLP